MENDKHLIQQALADSVVSYNPQQQNYECNICNKPMTGEIPLIQHLNKNQHKENGVRYVINNLTTAPESLQNLVPCEVKSAAEEQIIKIVDIPDGLSICIQCCACSMTLNGLKPLIQHLTGNNHKKKLRTSNVIRTVNQHYPENRAATTKQSIVGHVFEPSSFTTDAHQLQINRNSGFSSNNSIDLTPYPLRAEALTPASNGIYQGGNSVLNQRFDPVIKTPLLNNMPGKFEEENVKLSNRSPLFARDPETFNSQGKQIVDDRILQYENDRRIYICNACRLTLPDSPQHIEIHINKHTHKENAVKYIVSNLEVPLQSFEGLLSINAEEAVRNGSIIFNGDMFKCIACDTSSNGIGPLEQHCAGSKHLKKILSRNSISQQVQRSNSMQYLATPPSSPFHISENQYSGVSSATSIDDNTDIVLSQAFEKGLVISTDNNSGDQMRCRVCNITLNGHKNLKQHLEGTKHEKQVKKMVQETALLPSTPSSTVPTITPEMSVNPPTQIRENSSSKRIYTVESNPRGYVYVFNYMFSNSKTKLKERKGAQYDTENILTTFMTMGYKVFCHLNQTSEETENTLNEITRDERLENIDSLILFFLSHGNHPFKFYAEDNVKLDLRDIWNRFTDSGCPSMKKKPKIIFANFCRGEHDEEPEEDATISIPRDIAVIYAATEGITALRNITMGTYFIRYLCKILLDKADFMELRDIYLELDERCKSVGGRQPKWEDFRFLHFYFNPVNLIS